MFMLPGWKLPALSSNFQRKAAALCAPYPSPLPQFGLMPVSGTPRQGCLSPVPQPLCSGMSLRALLGQSPSLCI